MIDYVYDEVGNRTQYNAQVDTSPPTTAADPVGTLYNSIQAVTLTCTDGAGAGCDKIYYTTDGSTPNSSSPVYSTPIPISGGTTMLKFFARDLVANTESPIKSQTYTIDLTLPTGTIIINGGAASTESPNVTLTLSCSDNISCSQMQFSNDDTTYSTPEAVGTSKAWTLSGWNGNKTVYVKYKDTAGNWSNSFTDDILLNAPLISINGTTYPSLQQAYNAAPNGSTIKCQAVLFVENLTVNRDISVTLDGGYDATFTSNAGGQTTIRGMVQTMTGGGTITIKNFKISN